MTTHLFPGGGSPMLTQLTPVFQVADTTRTITASRADIGTQTLPYLRSALPGQHRCLTIAYAGARAAPPIRPGRATTTRPAGTVLTTRASLAGLSIFPLRDGSAGWPRKRRASAWKCGQFARCITRSVR